MASTMSEKQKRELKQIVNIVSDYIELKLLIMWWCEDEKNKIWNKNKRRRKENSF